ncbi:MAG TPA: MFS transporter, partial [candidate division Zixibacteria bacterium]|nr:MFS transporter [candidate division Zixibacteria bacterium]
MPTRAWLILILDNRFLSYLILFALWLMMFSASSQTMIMSPILPLVGDQLHIPQEYLGTLITSYSVMLGVFALITGPISDRIGRRRILLFGTGAMCITLFLH